jgi:hypothetical protein
MSEIEKEARLYIIKLLDKWVGVNGVEPSERARLLSRYGYPSRHYSS